MAANSRTLFSRKSSKTKPPHAERVQPESTRANASQSSSSSSSDKTDPKLSAESRFLAPLTRSKSDPPLLTNITHNEKFVKFLNALQSCRNYYHSDDETRFHKLAAANLPKLNRNKKDCHPDGSVDYQYFCLKQVRFYYFRVKPADNAKGYVCNKLESGKETGVDNIKFEFKYDCFRLAGDANDISFGLGIGSQSQEKLYDESPHSQQEEPMQIDSAPAAQTQNGMGGAIQPTPPSSKIGMAHSMKPAPLHSDFDPRCSDIFAMSDDPKPSLPTHSPAPMLFSSLGLESGFQAGLAPGKQQSSRHKEENKKPVFASKNKQVSSSPAPTHAKPKGKKRKSEIECLTGDTQQNPSTKKLKQKR